MNLNYEIVPFTYINRSTALRAVLAGEKVAAIDNAHASTYKTINSQTATLTNNARLSLYLGGDSGADGGVLQEFRDRFTGQGAFSLTAGTPSLFRAAAEICDVYLVPSGSSWSNPSTAQQAWYGSSFAMVGDNVRERPYADIYGRVTTKSNTFKVYYTVQSLKAGSGDLAKGQWNESRGAVTGEYRGSTTIERYIDSSSSSIPDYATSLNSPNLEAHYRWHVLENHQFVP